MADLTGQSFGRYHIVERLGEGGMATVYKAYDTRLERDVAVKVIRVGQFGQDVIDGILKRFEREAKALARLTHPNIVHINDYGEHEGVPYLVMDYLPGGTLKDRMRLPTSWQAAARLLLPVASALEYAHEHKIIHRDVKPANILLTDKGQPMLSDFGIAKILETEAGQTLTGTGVGIGTPEYMSPEQGLGRQVDGRADIYSLGIVFYELVTGRKPYSADTPMAVVLKHVTDPLPDPRKFRSDLPERVAQVLFKALAKNPEDRYQDAEGFGEALEKLERKQASDRLELPAPTRGGTTRVETTEPSLVDSPTMDVEINSKPTENSRIGPLSPDDGDVQRKSNSFILKYRAVGASLLFILLLAMVFSWQRQSGISFLNSGNTPVTETFLPTLETQLSAINQPVAKSTLIATMTDEIFPTQTISQRPPTQPPEAPTQTPAPERTYCSYPISRDKTQTTYYDCYCTDMTCSCQTQRTYFDSNKSETWDMNTAKLDYVRNLVREKGGSCQLMASPTSSPLATSTQGSGSTTTREKDGMVMVYVPAGEFTMGNGMGGNNEDPSQSVFLDGYWMDRTEVTNAQFALCVTAGACGKLSRKNSITRQNYYGFLQFDDYPVIYTSLYDAMNYCIWAGGHLPSNAEWEKAARGQDGRMYPWGNNPPSNTLLNYNNNIGDTVRVGQYPDGASPYGALDMAGNVWEWAQVEAGYQRDPALNPQGPKTLTGNWGVVRGGSWLNDVNLVRITYFNNVDSGNIYHNVGFRCARSGN